MGYAIVDDTASGGKKQEWDTFACKHCQAVLRILLSGTSREREGYWCSQCGGRVCNSCGREHFSRPEGPCRAFFRQVEQQLSRQRLWDTIDANIGGR